MSMWQELCNTPHTVDRIQVGRWSTRVVQAGTGPHLILMHGTGGHIEAWTRNLATLATQFHVVAYDFPGQGYSSFADHDLEIKDYQAHLADLMDVLGIDSAHLCGESLGGWVAVKFAAGQPDRVRRLVLNTPGGTMATPEVMERIRALSQAAADDPSVERIRARLEWLMADPASVTEELISVRRAIYAQPGFADSMRHVLCLQDPDIRRRNLISDDELAAIAAPTLVIWTSNDPSGPAAAGMEMAEKITDGEFQFIDHAGHWPQWEQRHAYHDAMVRFLNTGRAS
jgi:2-hydroxy-6-oxonona-2,4-dienedioate hydrolase